jgi:hypothetical protein
MNTRPARAAQWEVGETLADRFPRTRERLPTPLRVRHARNGRGLGGRRLLLTSFVWPFDLDRHRRLEAALAIAASHQVRVDKASASEWLPRALRVAEPQTLTVVWHSITQMYWSADELGAVETVLASSGAKQCLGEVGLEFDPNGPPGAEPKLRTRLWTPAAGPTPRQRVIGTAHYHGVPVTLAGEDSLKI